MSQEECAICYDAPADHLVVPCGHQCGCESCLTTLRDSSTEPRCPICRARFTAIVKVLQPSDGSSTSEEGDIINDDSSPSLATPVRVISGDEFEMVDIRLEVLPADPAGMDGVTPVAVRITVPEPDAGSLCRHPLDVACVLDISGSMGTNATYEVDGEERCDGMSMMNIACHAIKVVLATLKPQDRFSLVTFNERADLCFPLTNVTRQGRDDAIQAVDGIQERGQTNIWDGIKFGIDSLRSGGPDVAGVPRTRLILLLTDGRPTISPPEGNVVAFREYCRQADFHPQLSCFGFGYNLDSQLLVDLASAGNGTFAFIPTAPVLGTVFNNSIASVLSTFATSSTLILSSPSKGANAFAGDVYGGFETSKTPDGGGSLKVDIGPILFGQTREIVVPMNLVGIPMDEPYLHATLQYGSAQLQASQAQFEMNPDVEVAALRGEVVDRCREMVALAEAKKLDEAHRVCAELVTRLDESPEANDERIMGIRRDISGRVTKALDGLPRFRRWGRHYIRSVYRAHALMQCTNKLDHGVQCYGRNMFSLLRTRGEALFLALPPPTPSNPQCPHCQKFVSRVKLRGHVSICKDRQAGGNADAGFRSYSGGSSYNRSQPRRSPAQSWRTTPARAPARAAVPRPAPAPTPTYSMDAYTTEGGGCFGAQSTVVKVSQEDGEIRTVHVSEIQAGDRVVVSGNSDDDTLAVVVCAVRMVTSDLLVAIPNGPCLTSKHPIRVGGKWRAPQGMGPRVATSDGFVYNFVLAPRNAILEVDGYECVTLGHGIKGAHVEHAFYGTEVVLNELKRQPGWKDGRVSISGIFRDADGHAVCFADGVFVSE